MLLRAFFFSSILSLFIARVSTLKMMQTSFRDLIDKYDAFLIDQWGVLHNGKVPYDGVNECLSYMHQKGKEMILLSNSSRRKSDTIRGMESVGFDTSMFLETVTSGEIAWWLLKERQFNFPIKSKSNSNHDDKLKVFVFGNGDDDIEYVKSANAQFAASLEEADLILARGTFAVYLNGEDNPLTYRSADDLIFEAEKLFSLTSSLLLSPCIPMLISNPDMMRPGTNSPMPGQLASIYHRLTQAQAPIMFVGKPHDIVYDRCFRVLHESAEIDTGFSRELDRSKICCIGDSLEHDILGAQRNGLDSLWISNGVHAQQLGRKEGEQVIPETAEMEKLLQQYQAIPSYVIPTFSLL
jgi:HAD superfamily hydrolase (TIGR01459 family)